MSVGRQVCLLGINPVLRLLGGKRTPSGANPFIEMGV
jgi:hypothetical protein